MRISTNDVPHFRPPVNPVTYSQFSEYVHNSGHTVSTITADGFCYINSIQKILALDYDKYMAIEDIQSEILSHLLHFESLYSEYHVGDIAADCEHFFRHGDYVQSIVDVIVHSTPSALKMNQYIYQEDKSLGTVKVTEFLTHPTYPNVHLHFDYHPNYDHGNHYKPIIKSSTFIKLEDFKPHEHSHVNQNQEKLSTQDLTFDSHCEDYRFPTLIHRAQSHTS